MKPFKKDELEIIDTSVVSNCYKCKGFGFIKKIKCDICGGTGNWVEDSAIIITKDKDGQRIAMQVDQLLK